MNPHQPHPLEAWTEVLESSIDESRVLAGRDLKPGDTIVDLLPHPIQQPRAVAQEIPKGTQLIVGEDGRVYGYGLEKPADVVTVAGIPVVADDAVEVGILELRNAVGRVLAQLKLADLGTDEAAADYAERMILQGGAVPHVHPTDAEPEAGVMGHQEVDELDGVDLAAAVNRALAAALAELPDGRRRPQGRVQSIYVASSWRNTLQPLVVEEIRQATAAEVYDFRNPHGGTGFAWSSIDPDWEDWTAEQYLEALEHPLAEAGFASDFDAMRAADTFVLVLPCGRSAHLELGWAVGAGKRTIILTRDGEEPELMAKMVDHIATSVDDVVEWLVDQDAQAHHDDVAREERVERLWAEIDQVPIPTPWALRWDAPDADPLADILAAHDAALAEYLAPIDPTVASLHALEEVAVAAAVDVDVASVELLRDSAAALRAAADGPQVIRDGIATALEHAARTLEAGNAVDDLDDVLEIAADLAASTSQACRVCGCTNEQSCDIPGRCAWEEPDLCTNPECIKAALQ